MRKALLALPAFALTTLAFGQARLVMNSNAWMVIDASAWVVLENPAPNALTELPAAGSGGNISSEGEFDRIRWQIGATTGIYTLPWTAPSGVKMPLTYNKTTAGTVTPTSSVVFSTYNHQLSGGTWNNFIYKPSDVTHMNNFTTGTTLTPGATNESGHVVDRFWIMDTKAAGFTYAANPNVTLSFVYDRAEVVAGNTITNNSAVFPQRFNSTTNRWGDYLPTGGAFALTTPTITQNSVTGYAIPAAQYYRSWTLADVNDPLPVELTDMKAECENSQVIVTWTTATESNNDYYTVERSQNGTDWTPLGMVEGSGTTLESHSYTFVDIAPMGLAYYRLIQTDNDGTWSSSNMTAGGCGTTGGLDIVSVYDAGDGSVSILVTSTFDSMFDVALIDAQGKIMATKPSQTINQGITPLSIPKGSIPTGMYVVRLSNSQQVLTGRVVLN